MSYLKEVRVPDLGNVSGAAIIEIPIKLGEYIEAEQALITLESDKASMDIPAPFAGTVREIKVKVGDKVSKDDCIVLLETGAEIAVTEEKSVTDSQQQAIEIATVTPDETTLAAAPVAVSDSDGSEDDAVLTTDVHAGPGVRRLAREFGLNLNQIVGTGQKGRIIKEDLHNFVKLRLSSMTQTSGTGLPSTPQFDFSQFGAIENKPLSRIKKLSAQYLHRNWLLIPHVTQFNDADITELEAFRKAQAVFAAQKNVKLTPLVFIMKAVVTALKMFPTFNASLSNDGEALVLKKYFNLGIAVDTEEGLVVPVIRDVDKKSLLELAKELAEVSNKARLRQLSSADLQGSSFSISSLGGIGGTAFTPIVNLPDVAILGVSKAQYKPQYRDGEFIPRLMLPLCLSYDHRVIDGAEGARFIVFLADCLSDIRRWLL